MASLDEIAREIERDCSGNSTSDLVKRLRTYTDVFNTAMEAANRIEAQDERIKELIAEKEDADQIMSQLALEAKNRGERIEELEAKLEGE